MRTPPPTALGPAFTEALAWAADVHRGQTRRFGPVPYASHLLAVAALVLEDGADEQVAIAALVHDAVEDQGGQPVLDEIRRRFGSDVARIVAACTDSTAEPKPAWIDRKASYLGHLRRERPPDDVLTVIAADKLHNARALLADLHRVGADAWATFSAEPSSVLAYYEGISQYLDERLPASRNTADLHRVVRELATFAPFVTEHPTPA